MASEPTVELAKAYLQIVPSMTDFGKRVARELGKIQAKQQAEDAHRYIDGGCV